MATKTKGLGTLLQAFISGAYTTVGQRMEIDGPDTSVGTQKTTDLDSLGEEKRATIPDNGDLTVKIWLDLNDTTHQALRDWAQSPPAITPLWKVIFPTSPARTASFAAVLTGFKVSGLKADDYQQADVKLAISGLITWS